MNFRILLAAALLCLPLAAHAAPVPGQITMSVGLCDYGTPANCAKPNSAGALPTTVSAGSAIIGQVGIDQTTPGTTNLVAAGQSGTWNITNVSGTVSLPTGASTAANQTATQTPVAAGAATATAGQLGGCQYLSTLPTLTNTQQLGILCGTRGSLHVELYGADGSGTPSIASAAADTVANTTITMATKAWGYA